MADVVCENCPHRCVIACEKRGRCAVRANDGGKLALPYYGFITASNIDPIEKKPLAHFRSGSQIPSFGFTGCNLKCPFCQNWQISKQTDCAGEFVSVEAIIRCVEKTGFPQIAYTYSEPLVHPEFIAACMHEARKKNIANVLVTNGCCCSKTADEILALTDAANIDLKCFSKEKYADVLGGSFDAVLEFIENAFKRGVHIEITTLVVTAFNDTIEELMQCADYIAGLSREIPWHISAYHPAYKYREPPTEQSLLDDAARYAKEKLRYVHIGNR